MAYSDTQIRDYAHQLQQKGATPDEIESFVSGARAEQSNGGPPSASFDSSRQSFDIPKIQGSGIAPFAANIATGAENTAKNFAVGMGTNLGKAAIGTAQTAVKGIPGVVTPAFAEPFVLPKVKPFVDKAVGALETIKNKVYVDPFQQENATLAGKAGNIAGEAVAFAAPTSPIAKGQELLAASKYFQKVPWIVQKLAQMVPEAAGVGGTELAKTGGDKEKALQAGVGAGIFSGVTHIGADAFHSLIPQSVKENVAGLMGYSRKQYLSDFANVTSEGNKKVRDGVNALTTMVTNAAQKGMKVKGEDGIDVPFNPVTANMEEIAQAYHKTMKDVYDEYTRIADASGDSGAQFTQKDFGSVLDMLETYMKGERGAAYNSAAKSLQDQILALRTVGKNGQPYFAPVKPDKIQQLIQDINLIGNDVHSDAPIQTVALKASKMLRDMMDAKIESATGEKYQATRTAYSQMKAFEPELLKIIVRSAKKSKALSENLIDGLATIDIAQGILTGNPGLAIRGGLIGGVRAGKQFLQNPAVKLQRALRVLSTGKEEATGPLPARDIADRFFGSTKKVGAPVSGTILPREAGK